MIAAFFIPDAIVMATAACDSYTVTTAPDEGSPVTTIHIPSSAHVMTFWNRYALVFRPADENMLCSEITARLREVCRRWPDGEVPAIDALMPYIKKQIMDTGMQMLGVMAGYGNGSDGAPEQFVYQILGSNIRRVNVDNDLRPLFDYVCVEKNPMVNRLLQEVAVRNGDQWETQQSVLLHPQYYSTEMALSMARRLVDISSMTARIEDVATPLPEIESIVITPTGIIPNKPQNG